MRKSLIILGILALFGVLVALLWPRTPARGSDRFFADDTYHFETMRVLNDIAPIGGDVGEALTAIGSIHEGDPQSWYQAWTLAGNRAVALAGRTQDSIARGDALLRAHTYYRSAEFLLSPTDPKRTASFRSNVDAFYAGLDALKVRYERIAVPYGQYHLNAIYYPGPAGSESRPLLVVVGGYDSTMEELYLSIVAAALDRGYSVLTYEGPGQGSVLRQQNLHMQPDWEKPNGAVLDQFLGTHPKPKKIVLLGESLGGYLAPRAAAFDPRIDGVVAFDVWFDGYAIATRKIPAFVPWLRAHGFENTLNKMARRTQDPGARWAQDNGMWVLGLDSPLAVVDAFKSYSIAPVAGRITQDVLLLAGSSDHFVPLDQVGQEREALTHAHSVTTIVFDQDSGGSLHCQIGAPSVWQGALFDWLTAKFG